MVRDCEVFEASIKKYDEVGLESQPKKAVRRAATFRAVGAEEEGVVGFCSLRAHIVAGLPWSLLAGGSGLDAGHAGLSLGSPTVAVQRAGGCVP